MGRSSGLEQKLLQRLDQYLNRTLMDSMVMPTEGGSLEFEFGRRIGATQGIKATIGVVLKFFTDESEDKEL